MIYRLISYNNNQTKKISSLQIYSLIKYFNRQLGIIID